MINNQTANSPKENSRECAETGDLANEGKMAEVSRLSAYNNEGKSKHPKGSRQRNPGRRYFGNEYRGDGAGRGSGEYGRNAMSGSRKGYEERRWETIGLRQTPSDRQDGRVFGRRPGHFDNGWNQEEERMDYFPSRRSRRREKHSESNEWNVEYRERMRRVAHEENEELVPKRSGRSGSFTTNWVEDQKSTNCASDGLSSLERSMNRSESWNKEGYECSIHLPGSTEGRSSIRATESLLIGDLVDVTILDTPTDEILPILLFFEGNTEISAISSVKGFGLDGDLPNTQNMEVVLDESQINRVVKAASSNRGANGSEVGKAADLKGKKRKDICSMQPEDYVDRDHEGSMLFNRTTEASRGKEEVLRTRKSGKEGGEVRKARKKDKKREVMVDHEDLKPSDTIVKRKEELDRIEESRKVIDVKMGGSTEASLGAKSSHRLEKEEIPEELNDERYKYFLKRALPTIYRDPSLAVKYIIEQRSMLLERARINKAEIPEVTDMPVEAPKKIVYEISKITNPEWSEEEEREFKSAVIKCGNDFRRLREYIPNIETGKCILKYYLMKNKTFSYIKHRPGRVSDSEIKLIVENEWSSHEVSVFMQHFKVFGKNWFKYQTLISKTEKELRIFFRYYTKFIASSRKKMFVKDPLNSSGKGPISREEVLGKWTIDERQIFAIYFPYYSKNWMSMATYFPSKTSTELRQYYNKYYKTLSYNEQRLEASLYNFGGYFSTPPASHMGKAREEVVFCATAGVLFKN